MTKGTRLAMRTNGHGRAEKEGKTMRIGQGDG
jgi:hypothetical protein